MYHDEGAGLYFQPRRGACPLEAHCMPQPTLRTEQVCVADSYRWMHVYGRGNVDSNSLYWANIGRESWKHWYSASVKRTMTSVFYYLASNQNRQCISLQFPFRGSLSLSLSVSVFMRVLNMSPAPIAACYSATMRPNRTFWGRGFSMAYCGSVHAAFHGDRCSGLCDPF